MSLMTIKLSPRDERRIADLSQELAEYRVALLIGAGADKALAGGKDWRQLVTALFPRQMKPSAKVTDGWLVELALVARQLLGDERYFEKLRKSLPQHEEPSTLRSALNSVARNLPLIVTTNYTQWVLKAISIDPPPKVVDRHMLRSILLPEPGLKPEMPVLVHLHGKVESAILDRVGFDQVQFYDSYYEEFLRDLFEKWIVLAIGYSFEDATSRVAAAQARFERPEMRKTHVWFERSKGTHPLRHKHRAAMLAYAIHLVEVPEYEDVGRVISEIAEGEVHTSHQTLGALSSGDWETAAEILDQTGDYESRLQKNLFREVDKLRAIAHDLLCSPLEAPLLARIERHLRHHIYLITPTERAKLLRRRLWSKVAGDLLYDENAFKLVAEDPRLSMDFAVGYYELKPDAQFQPLIEKLADLLPSQSSERLRLAPSIWLNWPFGKDAKRLQRLRFQAAELGWESIEAKLTLDLAKLKAREVVDSGAVTREGIDNIQRVCEQAKRAAQLAGNTRRYLGGIILSSLWTQPISEAQAFLRAGIELADAAPTEPTIRAGLGWAWQLHFRNRSEAFGDIGWQPMSNKQIASQWRYWRWFLPPWIVEVDG